MKNRYHLSIFFIFLTFALSFYFFSAQILTHLLLSVDLTYPSILNLHLYVFSGVLSILITYYIKKKKFNFLQGQIAFIVSLIGTFFTIYFFNLLVGALDLLSQSI